MEKNLIGINIVTQVAFVVYDVEKTSQMEFFSYFSFMNRIIQVSHFLK